MTAPQLEAFLHDQAMDSTDLADLLGVTPMAVHQWLKGRRAISLTVTRLLKLFDKRPELMREFGKP